MDERGILGYKFAKCIVDVSRIDRIAIQGPHYMATNCSGESRSFIDHDKALLRVNHYVGSWESFIASNDVRRTKEMFNDRAKANDFTTYEMQGWLSQFVYSVGSIEQAKKLLEGVG